MIRPRWVRRDCNYLQAENGMKDGTDGQATRGHDSNIRHVVEGHSRYLGTSRGCAPCNTAPAKYMMSELGGFRKIIYGRLTGSSRDSLHEHIFTMTGKNTLKTKNVGLFISILTQGLKGIRRRTKLWRLDAPTKVGVKITQWCSTNQIDPEAARIAILLDQGERKKPRG